MAAWALVLAAVTAGGGCSSASSAHPSRVAASGARPGSCRGLEVVRFAEHLCDRLAADAKRITLRSRHRRQIRPGQRVQLVCMKSGRRFLARITAVRHTTWQGITDQELEDDGFSHRRQLMPIMRRYYPGIGVGDPATVYRWGRVQPCGAEQFRREPAAVRR